MALRSEAGFRPPHSFIECLPSHENYVEIDREEVDAWGIPALRFNCKWGENELAMSPDIAAQAAESWRRTQRISW